MSYPTRTELKAALLDVIERRGGRISLSNEGDSLQGQLADYFGLTEKQRRDLRSKRPSTGKSYWRSNLQGAVRTLVQEGSLDNSTREQLLLTPYGQRRRSSIF
jgi:hypothetical protein